MVHLTTVKPVFLALAASAIVPLTASKCIQKTPKPENIEILELSLPPVSASNTTGACDESLNPNGTGCIAQVGGGSDTETVGVMSAGNFLPDNKHVLAMVHFVGAPLAPDPRSIYMGEQGIIIKLNGETFSNGDSWKCITCGIPPEQRIGLTSMMDYPETFKDGKRFLIGDNIVDCGEHDLVSEECTPENTWIHPIRWEVGNEDGTGGAIRELRLHPDNVHLGYSAFTNVGGMLGQQTYFARLVFNPNPTEGLPKGPRYDLYNVTVLFNQEHAKTISADNGELTLSLGVSVGELRGFSGRGEEVIYIGNMRESGNIDGHSVNLQTGIPMQFTTHPEYIDPMDMSHDDKWFVILDTRATTRHMFLAAMHGVPPIIDLATGFVSSGVRNNGPRRFFQPWLLDRKGDRGDYFGQQINALETEPVRGSYDIDDPEWNAMADPRWSYDGTMISYWQAQTLSPQCGGDNPLSCYPSKSPGGRTYRFMLAKLVDRKPVPLKPVKEASDVIPWGTPYTPGDAPLARYAVPPGDYVLRGEHSGYANVTLRKLGGSSSINSVVVQYYNYTTDGRYVLNGRENATSQSSSYTDRWADWYSDLTRTGPDGYLATKRTGAGGFQISMDILKNYIEVNGTLVTTVNGKSYYPPRSGT